MTHTVRDAPDGTQLAVTLDLLRQMSMEVHAYLADAARLAGLSAPDVACIGIVRQAERDGTSLSAGLLGRRLGLSPGATTALLDRISRQGLVVRERSPEDARVVLVGTTERARELAREMFAPLNAHLAGILTDPATGDEDLPEVLDRLVAATEQARFSQGT